MNEDIVILTDRDEIADHAGRDLTDEEWLEIKVKLSNNKGVWQAVDEAIYELIEAL